VWDDQEFRVNGLELQSKVAVRKFVEDHAATAVPFYTDILKLPDASISELLGDLKLMQVSDCDEPDRVYLLYERIEACRRSSDSTIRYVQNSGTGPC
jgi:hypothetical protein